MKYFFCLVKMISLFAAVFLLEGCILLDGRPHRERNTSMSRAVETGDAGRFVSPAPYIPPPPSLSMTYYEDESDKNFDDFTKNEEPVEIESEEPPQNSVKEPVTGVFSIHNQVSGDDFLEDTVIYSLFVGSGAEQKFSLGGRLSYANMAFANDWVHAGTLKRPWSLDIGFEGKYYLTEDKHFLQPYLGAYIAYGAMFWSYSSPLIDNTTGAEIKKDHIDYIKLGAMAGLRFRITKSIRIAAEIRPEVMYTGTTTSQGFFNDMLDNNEGTYAGISLIYIDYD